MCRSCAPLLSRRALLAAAGGLAVAACVGGSDTGIGFNLVPPEQVTRMGLQSWQRVLAETRPSRQDVLWNAARDVSARLLLAAGENPAAWEVRVFEGNEANAFALPGNKIGIYEGMFRHARDEALLATVLAHEIAHNLEAHAVERVNSQIAAELGIQLATGVLGLENPEQTAALLGAGAQYGLILPFSRNQELEADRIGLFLMARAGFDPRASVALWQSLATSGSRPPAFLSTHPGPGDRIRALQAMMPEALAVFQQAAL